METVYEESYFLSAGEGNAEQEMALPLLVTKLIDIATAHANSLGIGNPSMKEINAGWVLSRLTVQMEDYPKVNTEYTISTWVEATNRHFSERAFRISGADGRIYGYARSVWMVMNTIDHTNVGLSHLEFPDGVVVGNRPPIDRQARHLVIVDRDFEGELPGNTIMATHPAFDYRFKYCDLDYYRHVNTVRYVTLLLNRFSLEEHDRYFVGRLELSFLHEAKYGMETQLLRSDADGGLVSSFLLRKSEDSSPLFFARMFRKARTE